MQAASRHLNHLSASLSFLLYSLKNELYRYKIIIRCLKIKSLTHQCNDSHSQLIHFQMKIKQVIDVHNFFILDVLHQKEVLESDIFYEFVSLSK